MVWESHLQKQLDTVSPPSFATISFHFLRRLAARLFGVGVFATVITILTTCLTVWISSLSVITPVSLSRSFDTWSRIVEFNTYVWLWMFVPGALFALVALARPQVDRAGGSST